MCEWTACATPCVTPCPASDGRRDRVGGGELAGEVPAGTGANVCSFFAAGFFCVNDEDAAGGRREAGEDLVEVEIAGRRADGLDSRVVTAG